MRDSSEPHQSKQLNRSESEGTSTKVPANHILTCSLQIATDLSSSLMADLAFAEWPRVFGDKKLITSPRRLPERAVRTTEA